MFVVAQLLAQSFYFLRDNFLGDAGHGSRIMNGLHRFASRS
jgi:hypothetical protein